MEGHYTEPNSARIEKGSDPSKLEPVVRTEQVLANPVSIGVLVLAIAAIFFVLYIGKEVAVPIALAIVLKLLLTPVMDFFQLKLRFPTPLVGQPPLGGPG